MKSCLAVIKILMFFLFFLLCGRRKIFQIKQDNFFPKLNSTVTTEIKDHGYWRQYKVCYPPFNWSVPKGLSDEDLKIFWAQPENHRHFYDTNSTNHCGIIRAISNGQIYQPFPSLSNVTHLINAQTRNKPEISMRPQFDEMIVFTGHWGYYFQHFFDNTGPQICLMMEVLGIEPSDIPTLIETSDLFPNVPRLWKRLGFSNIVHSTPNYKFSAKILFMVESVPRVHPIFFKYLRSHLNLPKKTPKKIIWISRKKSNSYYNQRYIINEKEVIGALRGIFGRDRLVIFDHSQYTFEQTLELFAEAKAIIGAHGGGMYNQFYAPTTATIIEIMPVLHNGLYPDQSNFGEVPTFSHMAVWSNSILIGQSFYRFYQITGFSNFNVNLLKFRRFIKKIPELNNDAEL